MSCAKSSMINAYRGLLPTSFYQVLPVYKGGLMYHSVRYFTIFWFTFKSHLNWAKFLQWPILAVHFKKVFIDFRFRLTVDCFLNDNLLYQTWVKPTPAKKPELLLIYLLIWIWILALRYSTWNWLSIYVWFCHKYQQVHMIFFEWSQRRINFNF